MKDLTLLVQIEEWYSDCFGSVEYLAFKPSIKKIKTLCDLFLDHEESYKNMNKLNILDLSIHIDSCRFYSYDAELIAALKELGIECDDKGEWSDGETILDISDSGSFKHLLNEKQGHTWDDHEFKIEADISISKKVDNDSVEFRMTVVPCMIFDDHYPYHTYGKFIYNRKEDSIKMMEYNS